MWDEGRHFQEIFIFLNCYQSVQIFARVSYVVNLLEVKTSKRERKKKLNYLTKFYVNISQSLFLGIVLKTDRLTVGHITFLLKHLNKQSNGKGHTL